MAHRSILSFAVVAGFAIGMATATLLWRVRFNHRDGHAHQVPSGIPGAPALAMEDTLKGCNVFVCSASTAHNALATLVMKKGARLVAHLDVETDLIVTDSNGLNGRYTDLLQTARELHIPVVQQSHVDEFCSTVNRLAMR